MMAKYEVSFFYTGTYTVEVDAKDEEDALHKARLAHETKTDEEVWKGLDLLEYEHGADPYVEEVE